MWACRDGLCTARRRGARPQRRHARGQRKQARRTRGRPRLVVGRQGVVSRQCLCSSNSVISLTSGRAARWAGDPSTSETESADGSVPASACRARPLRGCPVCRGTWGRPNLRLQGGCLSGVGVVSAYWRQPQLPRETASDRCRPGRLRSCQRWTGRPSRAPSWFVWSRRCALLMDGRSCPCQG